MSLRFVVISEARADFTTATELADRVFCELDQFVLDDLRKWVGDMQSGPHLTWKSIPDRARKIGIKVHGHFAGKPGLPDAQAARRAIAYVRHKLSPVDAIILIRDADDQPERRKGLEQARAADSGKCAIVIGIATIERESWVVSGFQPQNDAERKRLAVEIKTLSFNPCVKSHALTAGKNDAAIKSPKRVLKTLIQDDRRRESECWKDTPLSTLRERGVNNGLADYLAEIAHRLVPLITVHRQPEKLQ